MTTLEHRRAAVFGAASGIGAAIAVEVAAAGAAVDCYDVDAEGVEQTARAVRDKGLAARAAVVDVRDSAAVDRALAASASDGGLDIAVATPGINIRKPLVEYTDADYDAVVDVNLRGSFHVLRGAGRIMSAQGRGAITVISSISARAVEPNQVVYAGTKAALAQMVRVLAAELGPRGVRVNAIAPGPVETPLTAPIRDDPAWRDAYAEHSAAGRWARPAEIAAAAVFLGSDAASYISGSVLFVDGGWVDMGREFRSAGADGDNR